MEPLYIALAVLTAASLWLAAVIYSRHRWPRLACSACDGTGKVFEPVVFRVLCLRWRRRAWRPCSVCSGAAWNERPTGLSLR